MKSSSDSFPDVLLPVDTALPKAGFNDYYFSVSVDYINKKIYAIPADSDLVVVLDVPTNGLIILLSGLDSPKSIAVDPSESTIFIGQLSSVCYFQYGKDWFEFLLS